MTASTLPERVLITGAAGAIGTALRHALVPKLSRVRLSDLRDVGELAGNEEFAAADLTDFAQVRGIVRGMDAVINLGGVADEAAYDVLRGPNLDGPYNVFEACRVEGVPRVVHAGSNRITGFHPAARTLDGTEPVRPDGLYGATKAFAEALASLYADRFGLEVITVRIGSFEERPTEPRHLHTWLSHPDAARLFEACLAAPPGPGHVVVYGVSANARSWWAPSPAARALGYEPADDAEDHAAGLSPFTHPYQGGRYTDPSYGGWAVDPG